MPPPCRMLPPPIWLLSGLGPGSLQLAPKDCLWASDLQSPHPHPHSPCTPLCASVSLFETGTLRGALPKEVNTMHRAHGNGRLRTGKLLSYYCRGDNLISPPRGWQSCRSRGRSVSLGVFQRTGMHSATPPPRSRSLSKTPSHPAAPPSQGPGPLPETQACSHFSFL